MDVNVDLLQWFINFLIKKSSGGTVKNEIIFDEMKLFLIKNYQKNYTNQLLENLRKEK